MTNRAEYIKGLRALADFLETNEQIDLPFASGTGDTPAERVTFYSLGQADSKDRAAEFARAFPGTLAKEFTEHNFSLVGAFHGLSFEFATYRSDVCERVVKGTREVTISEPIVTGHRDVTKTIEDVEWVCSPLLADVAS